MKYTGQFEFKIQLNRSRFFSFNALALGCILAFSTLFISGCKIGQKSPQIRTYIIESPMADTPVFSSTEGKQPGDYDHQSNTHDHGHEGGQRHYHGGLSWLLPKGWQEQQAGGMRIGSFVLPGREQAEVSIVKLGQQAGGLLNNVNRWRGQLGLGPISDAELSATTSALAMTVGEGVSVSLQNGDENAMEVVVVETEDASYFIKFMAPTSVVKMHRIDFYSFVRTIDGF